MITQHTRSKTFAAVRSNAPLIPAGVFGPFFLVTALFFLWGIPNNLNDVLIRQFMKSFALSRFEAGLVQSAFYLGYFLLALPAGLLMKRFGYKSGFITGLILFATGCMLFWPAAHFARYGFFLAALFVVASGLAFLETAANPFIAQLGTEETSERRLNFSQAFNPLGSIAGVLAGTAFIFSGIELTSVQQESMKLAGSYESYMHHETMRVVAPYLVLGAIAALWAVLIAMAKFPAFIAEDERQSEQRGDWRELLSQKHFLFAVFTQFVYVGAQVGTWSYFIQYAQDYGRTTERTAGLLLTATLIAFGAGRFVSSALMKRIVPGNLMKVYALINIGLLCIGIAHPSRVGIAALLCTSFFMSIMFPTIFAMGLKDLGPNTNVGGSMIVMAIVGGAVLTPLMGLIAEHNHSTASADLVPLCSFVVVAFFSHYMARYQGEV